MIPLLKYFRRRQLPRASVQRLKAADAPALAAVHRTAFPHPWSSADFEAMLTQGTHQALGVKIGRKLIAFLLLRFAADEAEVITLATDKGWRGLGLGEKLMLQGFAQAMAQGARSMHLEVESENMPATALYKKLGFYETGRRGKYYASSGGGDAILMARELG